MSNLSEKSSHKESKGEAKFPFGRLAKNVEGKQLLKASSSDEETGKLKIEEKEARRESEAIWSEMEKNWEEMEEEKPNEENNA